VARVAQAGLVAPPHRPVGFRVFARRNPTIVLGAGLLLVMAAIAIAAPLIAGDPRALAPIDRLQAPNATHWFGTDNLGRDIFSRVILGTRSAFIIAVTVVGSHPVGLDEHRPSRRRTRQ